MTITVKNQANQDYEVAINQWGDDGSTRYYTIPPEGSESWDRSDERGFVMAVNHNGARRPYYVQHNSKLIINDECEITDNGVTIQPIVC